MTVVPFDTLAVNLAKKPIPTGAANGTAEPSLGVTAYGDTVNFGKNVLSGFVYLTCATTFNTTSATVLIKLTGNSAPVYNLNPSNGELTVKPVDKADAL